MILTGTLVNTATVLVGSAIGLLLGRFIPSHLREAVEKGISLCVIYIGIDGMLAGENALIAILSMVLGALIGEALRLDDRIHALGDWVERRFGGGGKNSLAEGFVSTSLLFCVGAMSIMGALDSGLSHDHSTLYAKSMLDGVSSIVYASAMGPGVMLTAITVLVYQGAITLLAAAIEPFLTAFVIAEMKCVGSLLILALGFNMLGMTKIKVMNYLPAMFLPILLCRFF